MELYLLIALFFIYLVMNFLLDKRTLEKVWLVSFILSFALTGVAIAFMRANHQDALMSVNQINWYFLLYAFGYVSMALGIINLVIYRKQLFSLIFNKKDDNGDDGDGNNV